MQGSRVRHLEFDAVVSEFAGREAVAVARADLSRINGVLTSVVDGEQGSVQFAVRKVERGNELDGGERVVERLGQLPAQFGQACGRGGPMESTDAGIDRMDCSATHNLQDRIAGLLQSQPPLDRSAVVAGEFYDVWVTQKVGDVQEVHVQGVTGNPFAAIEQSTE